MARPQTRADPRPVQTRRPGHVDRKKIRIVYKIVEQKVLIKIIASGKREEMAAYQNAFDRIDE
ncbi:mRNA interferase RelE/StbE [Desulfocicer vacuolatum DSM 3385]|uniref:mRNA interferase RelE/StbE n=1 Tax=Desulfocicer vacuolatum DSM 3385 TaxID=1121400 RepID=A0A1W2DGV0_9BACT|nr:hypothetical protein [Desulfocicer vacuolatum]SMC96741.1 mRNA interferase RelE/StbE [Desulfocicer vacuolatum DSM 3385]